MSCHSVSLPPEKAIKVTAFWGDGEKGEYMTWLRMVVMLVSSVVMIQFAFKLAKNPLAAKRE